MIKDGIDANILDFQVKKAEENKEERKEEKEKVNFEVLEQQKQEALLLADAIRVFVIGYFKNDLSIKNTVTTFLSLNVLTDDIKKRFGMKMTITEKVQD